MPHGGRREGSGRKKPTLSEQTLNKLVKAFEVKAKEHGKSVFDLLAEIAYNNNVAVKTSWDKSDTKKEKVVFEVPLKERLTAVTLYLQYTITKKTEKDVEIRQVGPTIKLPPIKQKPPDDEFIYPAMVN